ncbi:unnamed protein product [Larinioides sclopetarius]|uniref:Major facilitator superfamily (MFS) profile domain-containing protein n=1 Tax=Larinioides sclopetarius TaxID=280406 RepID=A0AAV2BAA1_9ARAC
MARGKKNFRNVSESKSNYNSENKIYCSNLKTCSLSGDLNVTNVSTEEIIHKPVVGRSFFQHRYVVALLGFSVLCQINIYRIATTISLIAMVNNSATSYETNSKANNTSCVLNSSVEEFIDYEIKGEFNWNPETQGLILSSGFLGFIITQIPAGILAEIYGGKITIVSGLLVSTIGHILSPLAAQHSSDLMIVVQFIRGAGQGFLVAAYSVIASNWFPSIERGLYNSLIFSGFPVGAMISGFSAGTLCSSSFLGGWSSVYYLYGGLGLLQCVCVQIFLYESPKVHPGITDEEKSYILHYQEVDLNKMRPPTPWKDIVQSIPVYAMTFAMFGAYWAAAHFLSIHSIFLVTMLHFSLEENGLIVSLTFVIQIMISFSTSFASDWLSRKNLVGVDKLRKGVNFIACLGYSLGFLGVYFVGCDKTISNLLAIIGMSFNGFVFGGSIIVPIDMSPTFAGTLMGLSSTVAGSAAFILPVIYGVLFQEEQSLEQWNKIYFISIAILMSSGIIFCLFGSAEVQPWNYVSKNCVLNNYSKDRSCENKNVKTDHAVKVVIHL